ncbi:MAG: hypothetical protein K1X28_07505 [Parachlamydiales bacterium]|nr:hypothetical protein [Parachlamydiales bacterium]
MRFFLFLTLLSLPFWLPSAYRRTIHPFRPAKCFVQWPHVTKWETPPLTDLKALESLKKPFTYFSKGGQSFVFMSQDGQYVLKIFHYDSCRIPLGSHLVAAFRKWLGLSHRRYIYTPEKIEKTFEACSLAFRYAQEQTGLVYIHLNPKEGLPNITLLDCFGRKHIVNTSQVRFALQKRAAPFLPAFLEQPKEPLFQSFHTLLEEISAQGIVNNDSRLNGNFGILDGKVVAIDFASFIYSPERAKQREIFFEKKLQRWIDKHVVEAR